MSSARLGIDARMIGYSGIGTYVQCLLRELPSCTNHPFAFSLVGNPKNIPSGPWPIQPASPPIYSLREQWEMPLAFRRLKADLIHTPHYNISWFLAGRTVATVHDLIHFKFPEYCPSPLARAYARFFFTQVIPKTRALLADSESTKRDLVTMCGVPEKHITVAYLSVDHERFRQRIPAHQQEIKKLGVPDDYFLYIGNLRELKNIRRLVEAYGKLRARQPEAPALVLVGRNFIPGFERVLSQIPQIHWLGEMRDDLLPALYQQAVAFCFPSLYEGFGLPPLESMASGTPVLCSDRGSLPEVVGDAALLVRPEVTDEIASAMQRIWREPNLRQELSAKGLKQAARFSWRRMAEQTLEVYKKCL